VPIGIAVLSLVFTLLFGAFNYWSVGRHELAIKKLRAVEHDLITQINAEKKNQ
jgi:hypothetical protein